MEIALSFSPAALSVARAGGRGTSPEPYAPPPANWRMPATVLVSSGFSASHAVLTAAQAAVGAKTRPGVTVTDGSEEYIEWTVAEAGDAILSFVPSTDGGTYTVEVNDQDQGFAKQHPAGADEVGNAADTNKRGRRQGMLLEGIVAGDVIRLTIAASGGNVAIRPLLHLKPAIGTWDAHLIFGASREDYGLSTRNMEELIVAQDATRDPIVFNFAKAGADLATLAGYSAGMAAIYSGLARFAYIGSCMGNTISIQRPWDSGENAAITGHLTTILTQLEDAGIGVCFGSTSYRQYNTPDVRADDQDDGSLPYNENILHPFLAANLPDAYDASLARAKVDDYLLVLYDRANLQDEMHGNDTQYGKERLNLYNSWYRRCATGTWSYTSQIETRVAGAEAASTTQATALTQYNEATYAIYALTSSSAKTALQARLDAIYPTVLFFEAKRLIAVAEGVASQEAVDAAQAMLDAAELAGYVDAASPDTISEQQERVDAIVVAAYDQIINVNFAPYSGQAEGWNNTAAYTPTGVAVADLIDDADAATGVGLSVTNTASATTYNGGFTSGVEGIIDNAVNSAWSDASNAIAFKFIGLDPEKTYDLLLMGCRNTANFTPVKFTVNGIDLTPEYNTAGNSSNFNFVSGVSPGGSGEIAVTAARGAGSSYVYLSVCRLFRNAA